MIEEYIFVNQWQLILNLEKIKFLNKTELKSDHFVGNYYVMFNNRSKKDKNLEILSHRILQKYEKGEKKTLALWKKMNKWALDGFDETYKKFGIKHDVVDFESKLYKKGKKIILEGLKKGLFVKEKSGAIVVDLKDKKLDKKIFNKIRWNFNLHNSRYLFG